MPVPDRIAQREQRLFDECRYGKGAAAWPASDAAVLANSTKTFGISYDGGVDVGTSKFLYRAEYADQSDYADNPNA